MFVNIFVVDVIVVIKNPVSPDEKKIPLVTSDTDFTIEIVELNSFGLHLVSGALFFHRINDIIYGVENKIVACYVKR